MLAVVHWSFCYTDIPGFFGTVNNCEYAIVRGEPCHALGTALGTRLLGTVADPSKDMQTNKLSARAVSTLKDPGRHSDGGGLYLLVKATGAKSWVFMWSRQGRQREMGLGSVLGVSLAVAREKAAEARAELAAGRDPLGTRDRLKARTFGELADDHVSAMSPQWRNPKHIAQWTMTLTEYAAPLRGEDGGGHHHGRRARGASPALDDEAGDGFPGARPHRERARRREGAGAPLRRQPCPLAWSPRPTAPQAREAVSRPPRRDADRRASRIHGPASQRSGRLRHGVALHHPHGGPNGRGDRRDLVGGSTSTKASGRSRPRA